VTLLCALALAACGSSGASGSHKATTTSTTASGSGSTQPNSKHKGGPGGSSSTTTTAVRTTVPPSQTTSTTAAGGATTTSIPPTVDAACHTGSNVADGQCEAKIACAQWPAVDKYIQEADAQGNAAIDDRLQQGAAQPDSTGPAGAPGSGGNNAPYLVLLNGATLAGQDDPRWVQLSDRVNNLDNDIANIDPANPTTIDQVAGDSETLGRYCKNAGLLH
jgi:hypothetical protein